MTHMRTYFGRHLSLVLMCLMSMASCVQPTAEQVAQVAMDKMGGMIVTLAVSEPEQVDTVAALLSARLATYEDGYAYISKSADGTMQALIPGANDAYEAERVHQLLLSPGEVQITETYSLAELLPLLDALNSTDSVFKMLNLYVSADGTPAHGAIVGAVHLADKDAVLAALTSAAAEALLPADLSWSWMAAVVDYEYSELVALKMPNRQPAFTSESLTDIESKKTKECPYPNISMVMDDADTWERFTGENIGRSIAFVVDGVVYSCPTVVSAIAGGRSQISGNMTYEQAADLAAIMKYAPLPAQVQIVEENIVDSK